MFTYQVLLAVMKWLWQWHLGDCTGRRTGKKNSLQLFYKMVSESLHAEQEIQAQAQNMSASRLQ
jgi:hypothetical protein